jgi:hypothetical protein
LSYLTNILRRRIVNLWGEKSVGPRLRFGKRGFEVHRMGVSERNNQQECATMDFLAGNPSKIVPRSAVCALFCLSFAIGYSSPASAIVTNCGPESINCTFTLSAQDPTTNAVLGTTTENYSVDKKGNITIESPASISGPWGSASLTQLGGNTDPSLLFAGGAINNTAGHVLFTFGFSEPISLQGPVQAQSQLNYGLTSQGIALSPAVLTPFNPNVLTARDLGNTGFISKNVDLGGPCSAPIGTTVSCGNLSATGAPFGNVTNTFVSMAATVEFDLSGHSSTGFNGQVIQNAVPEPSAYGMLVAGLAFIGFVTLRRGTHRMG